MESTTKVYGPIWIDPGRVSGTPCFTGSRVPIVSLFDWLSSGHSIEDYLRNFPSVSRENAEELLRVAGVIMSNEKVINENPVGRADAP